MYNLVFPKKNHHVSFFWNPRGVVFSGSDYLKATFETTQGTARNDGVLVPFFLLGGPSQDLDTWLITMVSCCPLTGGY